MAVVHLRTKSRVRGEITCAIAPRNMAIRQGAPGLNQGPYGQGVRNVLRIADNSGFHLLQRIMSTSTEQEQ